MRQIALRVPEDLHALATAAAEAQGESLNTYVTNALLSQVRAKNHSAWRSMVEESHIASRFRGAAEGATARVALLTGDE